MNLLVGGATAKGGMKTPDTSRPQCHTVETTAQTLTVAAMIPLAYLMKEGDFDKKIHKAVRARRVRYGTV